MLILPQYKLINKLLLKHRQDLVLTVCMGGGCGGVKWVVNR